MKFKALNPGLYVYHCAQANVANHMSHGMYGLILVEPKGGLPSVDRELYVMQGEIYTASPRGTKGLQVIDAAKMLAGNPEFIVFNGRVGSISKEKIIFGQDEKVRMYVGNGGVNLISSFHLIGEIFDTVYPEASMGGALFKNVQTTLVPAGGAAIVELSEHHHRLDRGVADVAGRHDEADDRAEPPGDVLHADDGTEDFRRHHVALDHEGGEREVVQNVLRHDDGRLVRQQRGQVGDRAELAVDTDGAVVQLLNADVVGAARARVELGHALDIAVEPDPRITQRGIGHVPVGVNDVVRRDRLAVAPLRAFADDEVPILGVGAG